MENIPGELGFGGDSTILEGDSPAVQALKAKMARNEASAGKETLSAETQLASSMEAQSQHAKESKPTLKKIPSYEEPKTGIQGLMPPDNKKDFAQWAQFAGKTLILTGMIGSLLASKGSTAAKYSLAAAFQGMKDGDKNKIETSVRQYNAHVNEIIKNNEMELKEYDNILYSDKLTVQEKFQQAQLAAKKWGNILMTNARSIKDQYAAEASIKRLQEQHVSNQAKQAQMKKDSAEIQGFNKHNQDRKAKGLPDTSWQTYKTGLQSGDLKRKIQQEDEASLTAKQKLELSEARKKMRDPKFIKENPDLANLSDEDIMALVLKKFPK